MSDSWPDRWVEYEYHVRDCRCGQPARATDGYLHVCSPECAADATEWLARNLRKSQ